MVFVAEASPVVVAYYSVVAFVVEGVFVVVVVAGAAAVPMEDVEETRTAV